MIKNTTVSIDRAWQGLWNQVKTEIDIVRRVFRENHPLSGDHPSFDELATNIYGPEGKLFQCFQEELKLSYEDFCRFLGTFYAASARSQPAPRLLDDSLFISNGMMTTADYRQVITKIEDSCGAGRSDSDSFWMELEHLLNSFAKKNFLSQRNNEDISLALDDDKHHFNHSKNSDTHGLKKMPTHQR